MDNLIKDDLTIDEVIKKGIEVINNVHQSRENYFAITDYLIELSGYMFYLGERYAEARKNWSIAFLKAKQNTNPISKKTLTDKEAECEANKQIPNKDRLKTNLDTFEEFIRTAKVKVGILSKEKEYEPKDNI